ncbi:MAG: energy transducer TonB [Gammaproteobacteria bacterium]
MRYVVSVIAGLAVALALFLLMHTLIGGGQEIAKPEDSGKVVNFIRIREEQMTQTKDRRKPPEPEEPEEPPPPPKLAMQTPEQAPTTPLDIETPNLDIAIGAGGSGPYIGSWQAGDASAEGDVVPIVKINPQWPREALVKGIEGFVELEFTIQPDGTVADVEVLNAEPRRLFVRDAIRAVLKWKFKPRIVDGQPVSRRATQRIEFKLEDLQQGAQ